MKFEDFENGCYIVYLMDLNIERIKNRQTFPGKYDSRGSSETFIKIAELKKPNKLDDHITFINEYVKILGDYCMENNKVPPFINSFFIGEKYAKKIYNRYMYSGGHFISSVSVVKPKKGEMFKLKNTHTMTDHFALIEHSNPDRTHFVLNKQEYLGFNEQDLYKNYSDRMLFIDLQFKKIYSLTELRGNK